MGLKFDQPQDSHLHMRFPPPKENKANRGQKLN